MKWLIESYPAILIASGVVGTYLLWTYVGLRGRWTPWPANIHPVPENASYVVSVRGIRLLRAKHQWEDDREGWTFAGNSMVFIVSLMIVGFIVSFFMQ